MRVKERAKSRLSSSYGPIGESLDGGPLAAGLEAPAGVVALQLLPSLVTTPCHLPTNVRPASPQWEACPPRKLRPCVSLHRWKREGASRASRSCCSGWGVTLCGTLRFTPNLTLLLQTRALMTTPWSPARENWRGGGCQVWEKIRPGMGAQVSFETGCLSDYPKSSTLEP